MDILKKIKELIDGQNKRKLIENTAIVIIIGIIIIIAGGTLFGGKKSENKKPVQATEVIQKNDTEYSSASDTEKKLKYLLSQVQGAGKVDVMITYSTSSEEVAAYDTKSNKSSTEENDNQGGKRVVSEEETQNTIAYEEKGDGKKEPVILKKIEPEIRGVLVVAEGASSITVRERLINAVTVALDIPIHRVEVVQRKK
jgi:stage III sporulation protein AG